ncbi:flagellin [Thalassospira sp.]|uniref:flagellin n=1 Tax=Thalassospira sp. TaxID=1912094 RepID=UPI002734790D|nr:flagellin [Thalassospira sp.]MDP2700343.1 flagellin [Thalassospira sp.]
MRVSTAAVQQSLLTQMRSVQTQLNQASTQSVTGMKSDNYTGVADTSYVLANLSAEISEAAAYTKVAETVQGRVDMYYDTLNSMVDILGDMMANISAAISSGSDTAYGITDEAQTALDSFAALLNTEYEDRYLYAGSATNAAPVSVDPADYAAITSPSTTDTSYYTGNSDVASAKIADGTKIEYGLTADMEPFEQALRALNLVVNASSSPVDEAALNEAYGLLETAVIGIGDMQTQMSTTSNQLDTVIDMHTDFQLTAEGIVSGMAEVDVAEALVSLETLSIQLEASYSAVAKVQGLSLFDYLS